MKFLGRQPTRRLSHDQAGAYALFVLVNCSLLRATSTAQFYDNSLPEAADHRRSQPSLRVEYEYVHTRARSLAPLTTKNASYHVTVDAFHNALGNSSEHARTWRMLTRLLGERRPPLLVEERGELSTDEHSNLQGKPLTSEGAKVFGIPDNYGERAAQTGGEEASRRLWTGRDIEVRILPTGEEVLLLTKNTTDKKTMSGPRVRAPRDEGTEVRKAGAGGAVDTILWPWTMSVGGFRNLSEEAKARQNRSQTSRSSRSGGPMTTLSPLHGSLPEWLPVSQIPHLSSSTDVQNPSTLEEVDVRKGSTKQKEDVHSDGGSASEGGETQEKDVYGDNLNSEVHGVKPVFAELDLPPLPKKKTQDPQRVETGEEQQPTGIGEGKPQHAIADRRNVVDGLLEAKKRRRAQLEGGGAQRTEDPLDTSPPTRADRKEQQDTIKREDSEDRGSDKDQKRAHGGGHGDTSGETREDEDFHGVTRGASPLAGTEQYLLEFLAQREQQLQKRADELGREQNRSPPSALLAQIALVHDLREMLEKRFSDTTLFADDQPTTQGTVPAGSSSRAETDTLVERSEDTGTSVVGSGDTSDSKSASAEKDSRAEWRSEGREEANSTTVELDEKKQLDDSQKKRQQRPTCPKEDDDEEERIRNRLKVLTARRYRREAAAALWTARKCASVHQVSLDGRRNNEGPDRQISYEELSKFNEILQASGLQASGDVDFEEEDLRLCPADDEAFAFLREAAAESASWKFSGGPSQQSSRRSSLKEVACSLWRQGCSVCGCFSGRVVCSRYCVAATARIDPQGETNRTALACCLVESKETGQLGDLFDTLPHTLLAVPYGQWDDGVKPRRRRPKPTIENNPTDEEQLVDFDSAADSAIAAEETASRNGRGPSTQAVTSRHAAPPATPGASVQPSPSPEPSVLSETRPAPSHEALERAPAAPAAIAGVPILREDSTTQEDKMDDTFVAASTRPSTQDAARNEERQDEMEEVEESPPPLNNLGVHSLTKILMEINPATRATVEAALEAASRAVRLAGEAKAVENSSAGILPGNAEGSQQQREASPPPPRAEPDARPQTPSEEAHEEAQEDIATPTNEPDAKRSPSVTQEVTISSSSPTEALMAAYQEVLTSGSGNTEAGAAAAAALVQLLQTPAPPPGAGTKRASPEESPDSRGNTPSVGANEQGSRTEPQAVVTAERSPETQSPLDNLLQLLRQQMQQQALSPQQQLLSSQLLPLQRQQSQPGQLQQQRPSDGRPQQSSATTTTSRGSPGSAPRADIETDLSGRDVGPYLGPPARCPLDCEVFFDGCTTCQCFNANAAPTCRPRWCRRMATAPTCLQVRPSPGPLECPLNCFQTFNGCDLCVCDGRGHRLSCRDLCALQNPLQRRNHMGEKRCVRQM